MRTEAQLNRIVPGAYILLVKGGEVLLQKRKGTGYEDGNYGLVSGHVEKGETFLDTIIREAREEANVTLTPENLNVVHVMHRYHPPLYGEILEIFFQAEKWSGDPENKELDKSDELRWVPLEKLPQNTIPYIHHAIECVRAGITHSTFGWDR